MYRATLRTCGLHTERVKECLHTIVGQRERKTCLCGIARSIVGARELQRKDFFKRKSLASRFSER